ncbi:polyphenol oxidase, chloroplastic [Morus notabilis]|uniref:polyphenol oxidase, chloroplastic n=1 Tax=Morus notabilis TaxID=981085 RepID=UPI000CED732E|nr:polyphenol oxidase, chloroplastic [Morus notabilis]
METTIIVEEIKLGCKDGSRQEREEDARALGRQSLRREKRALGHCWRRIAWRLETYCLGFGGALSGFGGSSTSHEIKLPSQHTSLRVRQPAHKVSSEYIAKYNKATEIMRNLPPSDPRNFMQQANIHALYCDGPDGDKDGLGKYIQFLVHNSWLFFPFHRWYVYFYEKILGNLIGDPNFALPFWNWDHPDGMQIPDMYTDESSALYDLNRSTAHQPPTTVDLDYHNGKAPKPREEQVDDNLYGVMYKNMVSGAKLPLLFFGSPYREGSTTTPGSIEKHPHNCVHIWTGHEITPQTPLGEDMGAFYSAGRDPIFFAHHANVDRMWNIWKTLDGPKRKDITKPDFLDFSFVFYDEHAQLVRVKIRDCLNTEVLGYVYEKVELPWLKERGMPHTRLAVPRNPNVRKVELTDFPITLKGSAVTIVVPRPAKKARSKEEKEEEEEVLVVEDISFDGILRVKFDVYVNDEYAPGPANAEFAGCFANVPHKHKHGGDHHHIHKVSLNLGITDLLDEIGADNDDSVFVTFVPNNSYPVTIGGIKLELLS